jgi:hypothetical protein
VPISKDHNDKTSIFNFNNLKFLFIIVHT